MWCVCTAQGVSRLLKLLLSRAQPKRVGVAPVTGVMLAGLAEAYVAAINDGAVPTIATAWQVHTVSAPPKCMSFLRLVATLRLCSRRSWCAGAGALRGSCNIVINLCACVSDWAQGVAEAECRRAAAAAEEVYIREFNQEGTPADADALLQEHLVGTRSSQHLATRPGPLHFPIEPCQAAAAATAAAVRLCKCM